MRNVISIILVTGFLTGCTRYTLTSFWVKNDSDKTINFKATITKFSSMGMFDMTLPFRVLPHDSVLARRAKFKENISPTVWFEEFVVFPVDSILLNDPNIPDNWKKGTDEKGKLKYVFHLTR